MIFNTCVAALAAFTVVVEAVPAATSSQRGFTVTQQATGKRKLRSGPLAMEATYKKFGRPVPDNVRQAAAAVQSGSVVTTPQVYDEAYLSPVQVGTPARTLMLDFDSGSSDLWVFCSKQPSSQTSGHTIYDPSSSSSGTLESGETWNIRYGDGSGAKGIVYSDKVVVGPVTATSQAVECATSVSSSFSSNTDNDGLLGLAFDNINTASPNQVPTFMDTVRSSLPAPIFASYLKKGAPGSYDFGYIDSSKYSGSLTYVNVDSSQGFWEFTASGYSVGSSSYSESLDSIADTGTTLIYLPDDVVSRYYSQVSGARNNVLAGGYTFPCSSSLPNFGVTIGGVSHTVPGSYMNYAPYSGSTCFGGLQSSSGIGINILGDIFLKSQYVVFDLGVPRIGFAQQA